MNKNCSYWKLILRYSLHIRFRDKLGVKVVKALKRNDDGVTHAAIDMLCALMQVRARNQTQCCSQNLPHARLVWLLCCCDSLLHSWEQLHCVLLAQLAIFHRGQFCWGSSISKVRRYTYKSFLVRSRDVHVYNPWAMNSSEESMFTCILWCQQSPWLVNNQ